MNRLHFLGLRLVRTLATLVIIVFITFAIFSLWPSDPATLACGRPCTPENLERAPRLHGVRPALVHPVLALPPGHRRGAHLR